MDTPISRANSAWELLKSVLAIPVVIAIVLGIGFGLVRLGELRQQKTGKTAPQAAEKGADGSLNVRLLLTLPRGGIDIHRDGKTGVTIANWRHLEDSAAWRFHIDDPGKYRVDLEYACDPADAGSEVQVAFAGTNLDATIQSTGDSKTFKSFPAGEVSISSAGWHELQITPKAIPHNSVMILKSVHVVPIKS